MKVNQKQEPIEGLEVVSILRRAIPQNELKKFYLQECVMYHSQGLGSMDHSEHEMLCILQKCMQKERNFFDMINSYPLQEGMDAIQKMQETYLLQNGISKKECKKINKAIADTMQLMTFLATNRTSISKLLNLFNLHSENIKKLLQAEHRDVEQE